MSNPLRLLYEDLFFGRSGACHWGQKNGRPYFYGTDFHIRIYNDSINLYMLDKVQNT